MKQQFHSKRLNQTGDTIVEVLLATVIMSTVIMAAYNLTQRAIQANQDGFERVQAANLMQSQAELIRVARNQVASGNDTAWSTINTRTINSDSDPNGPGSCDHDYSSPGNFGNGSSFHMIIDETNGEVSVVNSPIQTGGQDYVVWVDAIKSGNSAITEFIISSCWQAFGGGITYESVLVLRLEDVI